MTEKNKRTPLKAIRKMCVECMGGRGCGQNTTKLIAECGSSACPLFEFRFGTNPYRKPKKLMPEHKRALFDGRHKKIRAQSISL